jgi:ribonuclease HII
MKICGLDECGRGAFAGPLVAAAVIIKSDLGSFPSLLPVPLRDSKQLTKSQRNKIVSLLPKLPIIYRVEEVSTSEINEKGIGWANKTIFERLVDKVKAKIYIVDGNLKFSNLNIKSLIKGDDKCLQVMLASIIAKVYRDNLLASLHSDYPVYGWNTNSGYGSAFHIQSLREYGLSPHHRTQFVRTALQKFTLKNGT